MVHVEVEVEEVKSCLFLFEFAPCADAYARCVPSQSWAVGCGAEPEVAVVEQFHTVFLIEDGFIFACLFAVVASHADEVVVVECGAHVTQLSHEHLLCAKHLWCFEVYLVAYHLTACCPHVAFLLVAAVAVAYVVSSYIERLCAHDHREEQCDGRNNGSFHSLLC